MTHYYSYINESLQASDMLSIFHLIPNLMKNLTLELISSYVRWYITYVDQWNSFAAQKSLYDGWWIIDRTKEEDEVEDAVVWTRRCKSADNRYKNRTHYVPLEDESIQELTKSSGCDIVECQYMNCGMKFVTAQGLENHMNQWVYFVQAGLLFWFIESVNSWIV